MSHHTLKAGGIRGVGVALALGALSWAIATAAQAGCRDGALPEMQRLSASPGRFTPAVFHPGESGAAGFRSVTGSWTETPAVIGLWEFEFHLKGAQNGLPDGALFDWGLATWHSDGTEIQFSAGRVPSAGDVCMGAWREIERGTFKLHHIALGLTPPDASGTFLGPAIIQATVTVDPSGNSYSGPYSITLYPGSPDNGTEFSETGPAMAVFSGMITAKRVLVP